MAPTVKEVLKETEIHLSGVDSPRLSSELLLAHVVGCSRLSLVVDHARELTPDESAQFEHLVSRRAKGEPIAYILGEKEFYGLDFIVGPGVLIPRPETEHIVEIVETLFQPDQQFYYADLGTGSGILAVTIATLFQNASGVAVDLSDAALMIAVSNAQKHDVAGRIVFKHADFTTDNLDSGQFDLIVSNPPYVTEQEYADASHEVVDFEPVGALVSGEDGLDHIRAMMKNVIQGLKHGGFFLMEIGCGQGDAVVNLIQEHFPELSHVTVHKDLAGHDRIVAAQKL